MDAGLLKRKYLAAAAAAAGITGAIVVYAFVAEMLRRFGHTPPLRPPAAYAAKYALYILAVASAFLANPVSARLEGRKPTPEETVKGLAAAAIVKAAVCEMPAVCGLILFVLTGCSADLYLLLVFAAGLEIYHFPRLTVWEERLRGEGQL